MPDILRIVLPMAPASRDQERISGRLNDAAGIITLTYWHLHERTAMSLNRIVGLGKGTSEIRIESCAKWPYRERGSGQSFSGLPARHSSISHKVRQGCGRKMLRHSHFPPYLPHRCVESALRQIPRPLAPQTGNSEL